ncbi:unnamed protein product [Rotaria sp. Silwood1]|nr:unnamed protein product [Rotaria sp. Silwood1]CAF1372605.1 unnamed protein product [Rotaria sp. Silwood1]CAF1376706.1 unnamed protein product [Rotaria sp. Silwood1]CAF3516627.1 unnamed protein product [Rotaria sp. Silwood1]CAF3572398.1 unnamed protein product [Rotaria sp. Silwood1]
MMNEYHRLGIKNFKSIRHPGQIKLTFDLCTDDISAPQYVSSKENDTNQKIEIFTNNKLKFDYIPIKQSTNSWFKNYQYSKIFINILYLFFRILCIILKYTIYLIWYLLKIFLCIIFRLLTESKSYDPKTVICHPIRCYHH